VVAPALNSREAFPCPILTPRSSAPTAVQGGSGNGAGSTRRASTPAVDTVEKSAPMLALKDASRPYPADEIVLCVHARGSRELAVRRALWRSSAAASAAGQAAVVSIGAAERALRWFDVAVVPTPAIPLLRLFSSYLPLSLSFFLFPSLPNYCHSYVYVP